jgi:hypothetical protein
MKYKSCRTQCRGEAQDGPGLPANRGFYNSMWRLWMRLVDPFLNWSYNSPIAHFDKPLRPEEPINDVTSFVKSIYAEGLPR